MTWIDLMVFVSVSSVIGLVMTYAYLVKVHKMYLYYKQRCELYEATYPPKDKSEPINPKVYDNLQLPEHRVMQ